MKYYLLFLLLWIEEWVGLQLQSFLLAFITMTTLSIVYIRGKGKWPSGVIVDLKDLLQTGLWMGLYSLNSVYLHSQSPGIHLSTRSPDIYGKLSLCPIKVWASPVSSMKLPEEMTRSLMREALVTSLLCAFSRMSLVLSPGDLSLLINGFQLFKS